MFSFISGKLFKIDININILWLNEVFMIFEFPVLDDAVFTLPYYIKELGYLVNQDHVVRDKKYENNQILICTGGKGRLLVNNKEYIITENNVFFTQKRVPHEYYAIDEPWQISWIVFDGILLDQLLTQLGFNNHEVFELPSTKIIFNYFNEALTMLKSNNSKRHIECSLLIYSMLVKLSYCIKLNNKEPKKTKRQNCYENIKSYIEANYKKEISLDYLSEVFKLSTYHISRVFKSYNKIGLINYLNNYRISMAKKALLLNPGDQIKKISIDCGFKSTGYFISLFKKSEGMTPLQFREIHGFT